jgi:hypothetical protein
MSNLHIPINQEWFDLFKAGIGKELMGDERVFVIEMEDM